MRVRKEGGPESHPLLLMASEAGTCPLTLLLSQTTCLAPKRQIPLRALGTWLHLLNATQSFPTSKCPITAGGELNLPTEDGRVLQPANSVAKNHRRAKNLAQASGTAHRVPSSVLYSPGVSRGLLGCLHIPAHRLAFSSQGTTVLCGVSCHPSLRATRGRGQGPGMTFVVVVCFPAQCAQGSSVGRAGMLERRERTLLSRFLLGL